MDRLGIEYISVFGMPPVEFVNLAADLDCRYIGTALAPMPYNPHNYAPWSLLDDRALRREMIAAMHDRNVSISIGEGFLLRPGLDVRGYRASLEAMQELGVHRVNTVSIEHDLGRSFDQFAAFAEMAGEFGFEVTVEFGPQMAIPDLATALAAVRHVGRGNFRLLIDTMHLVRSGGGAADIAALDPALIAYAQLCDVPRVSTFSTYMDEAKFERMVPGSGELPLLAILAALPRELVIGLEIPQRSVAEAGVSPHVRLRRCVEAARGLLSELESAGA